MKTFANKIPKLLETLVTEVGFNKILITHNTPEDEDLTGIVSWVKESSQAKAAAVETEYSYTGLDRLLLTGLTPGTEYDYSLAFTDELVSGNSALLTAQYQGTNTLLNLKEVTEVTTLSAATITGVTRRSSVTSPGSMVAVDIALANITDITTVLIEVQEIVDSTPSSTWDVLFSGEPKDVLFLPIKAGEYNFRITSNKVFSDTTIESTSPQVFSGSVEIIEYVVDISQDLTAIENAVDQIEDELDDIEALDLVTVKANVTQALLDIVDLQAIDNNVQPLELAQAKRDILDLYDQIDSNLEHIILEATRTYQALTKVGVNNAQIEQTNIELLTETEARATAISQVEAVLDSARSAIAEVSTAQSNLDQATALKFTNVQAQFDNVTTDITQVARAVASESESRATLANTLTASINNVESAAFQEIAEVTSALEFSQAVLASELGVRLDNTDAEIINVSNVLSDATQVVAENLETLSVSLTEDIATKASIESLSQVQIDLEEGIVTAIAELELEVSNDLGEKASISNLNQLETDLLSSRTTALIQLKGEIEGSDGDEISTELTLSALKYEVADEDGLLASSISALRSDIEGEAGDTISSSLTLNALKYEVDNPLGLLAASVATLKAELEGEAGDTISSDLTLNALKYEVDNPLGLLAQSVAGLKAEIEGEVGDTISSDLTLRALQYEVDNPLGLLAQSVAGLKAEIEGEAGDTISSELTLNALKYEVDNPSGLVAQSIAGLKAEIEGDSGDIASDLTLYGVIKKAENDITTTELAAAALRASITGLAPEESIDSSLTLSALRNDFADENGVLQQAIGGLKANIEGGPADLSSELTLYGVIKKGEEELEGETTTRAQAIASLRSEVTGLLPNETVAADLTLSALRNDFADENGVLQQALAGLKAEISGLPLGTDITAGIDLTAVQYDFNDPNGVLNQSLIALKAEVKGSSGSVTTGLTLEAIEDRVGGVEGEFFLFTDEIGRVTGIKGSTAGGKETLDFIGSDIRFVRSNDLTVAFEYNTTFNEFTFGGKLVGVDGEFTGTVQGGEIIGGTIKTSDTSLQRVEITDTGNYHIWAGTGTKNDANANFYVKDDGETFFSGSITGSSITGGTIRTSGGNVINRIEISASGDYLIWAGSDTKNDGNADFYVKDDGSAFFSGDIEGSSITGGTLRTSSGTSQRVEISDTGNYHIWVGSGVKNDVNADFFIKTDGTGFLKDEFFQGFLPRETLELADGFKIATTTGHESEGKPVKITGTFDFALDFIDNSQQGGTSFDWEIRRGSTVIASGSAPYTLNQEVESNEWFGEYLANFTHTVFDTVPVQGNTYSYTFEITNALPTVNATELTRALVTSVATYENIVA